MSLRMEIEAAINRNSKEDMSDTPDFILAEYLMQCLKTFNKAIIAREKWYERECPVKEAEASLERWLSEGPVECGS